MEIPEPIENINNRLTDFFGKFENGDPNFRVVWADDQLEKRLVEATPSGIALLHPEIREVPKYWYCKHRYILERLVPVPSTNSKDLVTKISYEPIWVFEDAYGNALPPKWEVIVILVRTLQDQMLYKKGPYKIPEGEGNTIEEIEEREKRLRELLYGNETELGDSLAAGSAVGYGELRRNDSRFLNNPIKIH